MRMKRVVTKVLDALEKTGAVVVEGRIAQEVGRALQEMGRRDRVVIGWDRRHKVSAVVAEDKKLNIDWPFYSSLPTLFDGSPGGSEGKKTRKKGR